jgi:hypothetical protein
MSRKSFHNSGSKKSEISKESKNGKYQMEVPVFFSECNVAKRGKNTLNFIHG